MIVVVRAHSCRWGSCKERVSVTPMAATPPSEPQREDHGGKDGGGGAPPALPRCLTAAADIAWTDLESLVGRHSKAEAFKTVQRDRAEGRLSEDQRPMPALLAVLRCRLVEELQQRRDVAPSILIRCPRCTNAATITAGYSYCFLWH